MSGPGSKRGYTMIEVMVALSMLAVGATSVMALQKATYINNTNARNLVLANSIASTWAERLRTDALQWNKFVGAGPAEVQLDLAGDPVWLGAAETSLGRVAPLLDLDFGSAASDVVGTDIYDVPEDSAFCTHLRYSRFSDTSGVVLWPNLIRVEIRVFWSRNGGPLDCAIDPATVDAEPYNYGAVYLTTSVLRNTSL